MPPGPDALNVRLLIARGRARCTGSAAAIGLGERDLDAAAVLAAALPDLSAGIPLYRGNCALSRGDYARAGQEFRQALDVARQRKSTLLEGKAAGGIGMAATSLAEFDEAVTWYERALAVPTTDLVRLKTLLNLGWCQYSLGDFERALTFLAEADAIAQARGDASPRLRLLVMSGNAHYRLRNRARAADAFRQSLAIARELGDRRSTAELLGNLAIVALDRKQLDTAQALVTEALQIKTEMGYTAAIQHSRMTEGQIKAAAGDATAAERAYRRSSRRRTRTGICDGKRVPRSRSCGWPPADPWRPTPSSAAPSRSSSNRRPMCGAPSTSCRSIRDSTTSRTPTSSSSSAAATSAARSRWPTAAAPTCSARSCGTVCRRRRLPRRSSSSRPAP